MHRPRLEIDQGHPSTLVHHHREDSTSASISSPITLHITKQDLELRERRNRETGNTNCPSPSPQAPLDRSTINGRSSRHHQVALMPQVTYDKYHHDGTLRVMNPAPTVPSRTVREVWALYGEPDVEPRKIDRPSQLQQLRVINPDKPQSALDRDSCPSEPLNSHNHQQPAELPYAHDGRPQANSAEVYESAGIAGVVSLLERTVPESFALIRRGSGRRAKFRRDVEDFLGIKRD